MQQWFTSQRSLCSAPFGPTWTALVPEKPTASSNGSHGVVPDLHRSGQLRSLQQWAVNRCSAETSRKGSFKTLVPINYDLAQFFIQRDTLPITVLQLASHKGAFTVPDLANIAYISKIKSELMPPINKRAENTS